MKQLHSGNLPQSLELLLHCMLGGGEDALKSLIASRQQSRAQEMDTFFSTLEDKYCTKKPRIRKTEASTSGTSRKKKHKK